MIVMTQAFVTTRFVIREVVSHGPSNSVVVELCTREQYGAFDTEGQAEQCARKLGEQFCVGEALVSIQS